MTGRLFSGVQFFLRSSDRGDQLLPNRIRELIVYLYLFFLTMGIGGCYADVKNQSCLEEQNDSVVIADCAGRQVEVPENVDRISCLYSFTHHVVYMLGKGECITSASRAAQRDVLFASLCPGHDKLLYPYSQGSINIEELIKSQPDIVFISSATYSNKPELDKLEKAGLCYMVIDYHNMQEQMRAIEIIGRAIGCEERAGEYNNYYKNVLEKVKKLTKRAEDQKISVYHCIRTACQVDGSDSLSADWINAAGGVSVSAAGSLRLVEGNTYASLEQIMLWDPDVIVANETGVPAYIMSNPGWAALRAVKNHCVYQLPQGMTRWGHDGSMETPLAVLWLASTLYPEQFADWNLEKEVKDYYKEFFYFEITDNEYQDVIDGKIARQGSGRVQAVL